MGFSHFVSLGEHADVDFGDMLDWLASDAHTRAILLYIESIESPRKFMSAARAAARNKPVLVVKAGRSAQGQRPRRRTPARWPAPTSCSTPPSAAPACCAWTRCRTCSSPPRRWRATARHQRRRLRGWSG
jgi:succinyl-CoA synthetase alpha subunit